MKHITINFGLVASKKFPDVAQKRVLTGEIPKFPNDLVRAVGQDVLDALKAIGCKWVGGHLDISTNPEPTLVLELLYPFEDEKVECTAPMKYEPYMRLYEVACFFAQDCVAVLPEGEEGLLVGANCRDWGCRFNADKFINS